MQTQTQTDRIVRGTDEALTFTLRVTLGRESREVDGSITWNEFIQDAPASIINWERVVLRHLLEFPGWSLVCIKCPINSDLDDDGVPFPY